MLVVLALVMGCGLIVQAVTAGSSPTRSEALAQLPPVPGAWAEQQARRVGDPERGNEIYRQRFAAGVIGFIHSAGWPLGIVGFIWLGIKSHDWLFPNVAGEGASTLGGFALVGLGIVLLFLLQQAVWIPLTDGVRHFLGWLMVDYSGMTVSTGRRRSGAGSNPYKTGHSIGIAVWFGCAMLWAKLYGEPRPTSPYGSLR